MSLKFTYHCHTDYSDGANSAREMVEAALAKGFDQIGFSDHLVLHPSLPEISWSMKLDAVSRYVDETRALAAEFSDISVLTGVEVDFFVDNPRAQELQAILDQYQFDFEIGSVHMLGEFSLDDKAEDWAQLSQNEVNDKYCAYFGALKAMVEWRQFDFVGHLDLPKKFDFKPTIDIQPAIDDALVAIQQAGTAIEINTAGWDKDCREAYPQFDLLKKCVEMRIPILINDDAHCIDDLGRYFDKAEAWLQQLNVPQQWHL